MDAELLPCPFCGGAGHDDGLWIVCGDCGATGASADAHQPMTASESWNRRDPNQRGYVDALYEMAGMLGIGAMPCSPAEAYRDHIKPKLVALLERGAADGRACPDCLDYQAAASAEADEVDRRGDTIKGLRDAIAQIATRVLRLADDAERRGLPGLQRDLLATIDYPVKPRALATPAPDAATPAAVDALRAIAASLARYERHEIGALEFSMNVSSSLDFAALAAPRQEAAPDAPRGGEACPHCDRGYTQLPNREWKACAHCSGTAAPPAARGESVARTAAEIASALAAPSDTFTAAAAARAFTPSAPAQPNDISWQRLFINACDSLAQIMVALDLPAEVQDNPDGIEDVLAEIARLRAGDTEAGHD